MEVTEHIIKEMNIVAYCLGITLILVCTVCGTLALVTWLVWDFIVGPTLKQLRVWVWLSGYVRYRKAFKRWLESPDGKEIVTYDDYHAMKGDSKICMHCGVRYVGEKCMNADCSTNIEYESDRVVGE